MPTFCIVLWSSSARDGRVWGGGDLLRAVAWWGHSLAQNPENEYYGPQRKSNGQNGTKLLGTEQLPWPQERAHRQRPASPSIRHIGKEAKAIKCKIYKMLNYINSVCGTCLARSELLRIRSTDDDVGFFCKPAAAATRLFEDCLPKRTKRAYQFRDVLCCELCSICQF